MTIIRIKFIKEASCPYSAHTNHPKSTSLVCFISNDRSSLILQRPSHHRPRHLQWQIHIPSAVSATPAAAVRTAVVRSSHCAFRIVMLATLYYTYHEIYTFILNHDHNIPYFIRQKRQAGDGRGGGDDGSRAKESEGCHGPALAASSNLSSS